MELPSKVLCSSIILSLTSLFLAGCGGDSTGSESASVASPDTSPAAIVPAAAILSAGQQFQFTANVAGSPIASPTWMVNDTPGGSSLTGTIDSKGLYIAPAGPTTPNSVAITVTDTSKKLISTSARVSLFSSTNFEPGSVSSTGNPLVALYSFSAPLDSTVAVNFGTTTAYGLSTWSQAAPPAGGKVNVLVAGMRAATVYHMQAVTTLAGGGTVTDVDQTFTTGPIPADMLPNITTQTTPSLTPGDGVEMLNLFQDGPLLQNAPPNNQLTAVVTDLEGNVIWYFPIQPEPPFPMKPLPNGHILVVTSDVLREIDLAGNAMFTLPLTTVEAQLNASGPLFPKLGAFHHDALKLDNGHYIFLIDFVRTDIPGEPPVTGDAIVDWDPSASAPAWFWNAFDHLSVSRGPTSFPDWTHSNALAYSPDDGNLLLSMRNQNWVIKINYADGKGDGTVLWHLGYQGDFTLPAGVGPIEWNYGQHYPVFTTPSTAGNFSLILFNNGTNRVTDDVGDLCGTPGQVGCYSSVITYQLNEFDKTAQILFERSLSPTYSFCCGSLALLSNGNLEYDIAAPVADPAVSSIQEISNGGSGQLAWQMDIHGELAYRGFRIPSLYPGVIWSQAAMATATSAAKKVKPTALAGRATTSRKLQSGYIPRARP